MTSTWFLFLFLGLGTGSRRTPNHWNRCGKVKFYINRAPGAISTPFTEASINIPMEFLSVTYWNSQGNSRKSWQIPLLQGSLFISPQNMGGRTGTDRGDPFTTRIHPQHDFLTFNTQNLGRIPSSPAFSQGGRSGAPRAKKETGGGATEPRELRSPQICGIRTRGPPKTAGCGEKGSPEGPQ